MTVTFNPDPQTEIEAVNSMLLSIGKSPVNSLNVPGVNDVSQATTTLYGMVREVQARTWWFNTEAEFPITANSSGQILRPEGCLDFTPSRRDQAFVERNGMLYDLDMHTFVLTPKLNGQPLKCDVRWCFPFEQVPQVARSYIARRAGRVFQANVVGAQLLYQFTKEMELDAAAELERAHLKNSKTNMFTSPTRNSRIWARQPDAYRRSW